jgi:hypothetical protein
MDNILRGGNEEKQAVKHLSFFFPRSCCCLLSDYSGRFLRGLKGTKEVHE